MHVGTTLVQGVSSKLPTFVHKSIPRIANNFSKVLQTRSLGRLKGLPEPPTFRSPALVQCQLALLHHCGGPVQPLDGTVE